jgi:hypothetical protein
MIVTPEFVFISNPRTGSSFARRAIRLAYAEHWSGSCPDKGGARELILPICRGLCSTGSDHHGTVSQIPQEHAGKPIVSAVRNPFTHLISIFELGLWRKRADPPPAPNCSLEEFLAVYARTARRRWSLEQGPTGAGPLSLHFVQMFASDPKGAFAALREGATPAEVEQLIAPVTFLRQEALRDELLRALALHLTEEQLTSLATALPTHITSRSRPWSKELLNRGVRCTIRHAENFLFDILAKRGIVYDLGNADFSQPRR